jgi:hypothetical protein
MKLHGVARLALLRAISEMTGRVCASPVAHNVIGA